MNIESIIHTYSDYLYRIAFVYTKDEHVSEEIVQDVFLKFYQKSEQFRGDAALKTYLVKMTIHRSYDYLRSWKNKKYILLEKLQHLSSVKSTESMVAERETRGEITAAVLTLPLKDREVLLLHYYEQYTTKEIAQLLGLPESTVKSRLVRAREKLRPKLAVMNKEVLWDELT